MRIFLSLCLVIFLGVSAICQDKEKLVGTWTVGIIREKGTVMDFEKDSLFIPAINLSNELSQAQKDSALANSKKMLKEFFLKMTMEFKEDDTYKFNLPFKDSVTGKYEIDSIKKQITSIEDTGKQDKMEYEFNSGLLFLKTNGEDSEMQMGLRKIK